MNICIVSVFYSSNQGSFQQLKELGDAYSVYGDVYYLDNGIRDVFEGLPLLVIACLRRGKFKKALFEIKRRFIFYNRYRKLNTIKKDELKNMDLIVLGSDEIWNYRRTSMRHSFLWGEGIQNTKVSYAPSVGNSDVHDLAQFPDALECLNHLELVSVRDEHSKQSLIDIGYKGDIFVLPDPTFIRSASEYRKECKINIDTPYIVLYCFLSHFDTDSQIFELFQRYARSKGLRILSGGGWSDYAQSIQSDGCSTFEVFLDADCVITNTFHGTAFAINFNKRFITFSSGRETKIKSLLKQVGLEDRDCTNRSFDEIMKILEEPINYENVNEKIKEMREAATEYIKKSVDIAAAKMNVK